MKIRLSKSVIQLREQIDDTYPNRDRRTDGTIGDAKHDSKSDQREAAEAEAAAVAAAKAAGQAKLTALGLTAEEIAALTK